MPSKTRRRATLALAVLVALVATLFAAGGARAETDVDRIAQKLRSSPVYVDPGASDSLSTAQAHALADRIRATDVPIYVAVLPDDRAYGGERIFPRLRAAVDSPGVYAVALGSSFGAASDASVLPGSTSQALAEQNLRRHPDDLPKVLAGFVADVAAATSGQSADGDQGAPDSTGSSTGGALVLLIILVVLAGTALFAMGRTRKRRRERERAELEQVRGTVQEDITAYGEKLSGLGFTPSDPSSTPEMVDDYVRALDAYEEAKAKSDTARRPGDVRAVTEALEDGRFSLAVLEARRAGTPLPERRPPCFFDPRHGPSVGDVTWAPAGGAERPVPACAADATRIEEGLDPDTRTVAVGAGGRRPYWEAGPAYAPWAGGYFGGYGAALLPALLVGTMLGGSLSPGYDEAGAFGDGGDYGGFGDGGDHGDGGGFDGGFGGGDFGGGFGGGFGDGG
ncbi:hypothetical protein HUT19_36435 [Streptomyces sp. NA02950]|uniref:hypothetical protein n=1 Tax=Streptomyces sp. NA02950 TaxID=2742137 RepID=UPI0015980531|nr:hypothetical protein [Streptomyces sp. NA02950]QKV96510.1 hypothetical protein HUT19_36435 [Streptomyces sp. NA02950]